jgi:hypothetical protein
MGKLKVKLSADARMVFTPAEIQEKLGVDMKDVYYVTKDSDDNVELYIFDSKADKYGD